MTVISSSSDASPAPPTLYRGTESMHICLTLPPLTPPEEFPECPTVTAKYPAKTHARSVASRLPTKYGLIYLEGMPLQTFEDSDMSPKFRQRRGFLYMSGVVDIPDCKLVYTIETDCLTLYIPPLDPNTVLWTGMPLGLEECLKKYDIDACSLTTSLIHDLLRYHLSHPLSPVYHLPRHAPHPAGIPSTLVLSTHHLSTALSISRVYKSPFEISLIRHANLITSAAHRAVLSALHSSYATNETHLEAAFLSSCISRFAKTQAYDPIIGSGRNAATLHYTRNSDPLKGRQFLLVDAAAEWQGYAADVTRTYPIPGSGVTKEARATYHLVEHMQSECIRRCVAGMDFLELHRLAHRLAVRGLLEMGILRGDEEEILQAGTSRAFFPHGLGHMLGLDVHDVDIPPTSSSPHAFNTIHAIDEVLPLHSGQARIMAPRILEENMVVTIEPGIYFCEWVIRPYLGDPVHGKYINENVLERYWDVGGVRIEDDILILAPGRGNDNLTTAPKW